MSYSGRNTQNALAQISANVAKCLSLWRNIKVLCQARESMSTGVIRDISDTLEATLQSGEHTAGDIPFVHSRSKAAFDLGDDISHQELQNVVDSQRELIETLEGIKNQLTAAFEPQSGPAKGLRRAPNPERVLDIETIWRIVESINHQLKAKSEALKGLVKRIGVVPMQIPGQDGQQPSIPGSFPPVQSFTQPRTPVSEPSARTLPRNSSDGSPAPTLRLRPEQAPPQPPQPQEPIIVASLAPSAPERQPSTERRTAARPVPPPPPDMLGQPGPVPGPLHNISGQPGTFCTGAIRLQRDRNLSVADIARDSGHTIAGTNSNSNTICKHCNLELDSSLPNEIVVGERKRTIIAMQHILACSSLIDMKAMFRCLPCSKAEQDAEFRAAADLWQHMSALHTRSR